MSSPAPQRVYRAACPHCGAPVEFRSAASALAVCGFCRSTLVREGEALRRIGESAELFEDHSPLQIGAAGRWQGAAFTIVGRVQLRSAGGVWNEWHAFFGELGTGDSSDDAERAPAKSGWLSEDNGGYVMSFDAPPPAALPPPELLVVGRALGLESWSVASLVTATLGAAEGELPALPSPQRAFVVAELRNAQGEVASIDYAPATEGRPPRWSVGRGLDLAALGLTGLREASARELAARSLACPNCGAPLEVQLASTRSIVCAQCRAVVDVSESVGADLATLARSHYAQDTPPAAGAGEPLIPLGRTGTLAIDGPPRAWQVVGYVERCTVPGGGDGKDDEDDEQSFWREYLLYQRESGFAFLVDAEDGWSGVRPLTGAPFAGAGGDDSMVRWRGIAYRRLYRYTGQITYVLGEFYWRLERGQRTLHTDYAGPGARRLNREQTAGAGRDAEVTWSAGTAIDAAVLAKAFALEGMPRAALQRDVQPVSGRGSGAMSGLFVFLLFALVVFSLVRCSRDDCSELRRTYGEASNEYRQCARAGGGGVVGSGGSFGGFRSGGGHK